VKYAKEVILQRFDMAFDTLEAGTKTIERTVSWARINRHSGFNFGVMCDSWGSGFGDLEPFDVETEALRTEC
jgi:hypothetical protein